MEYVIKSGDTLSKIALNYSMTWPELYNYDGGTGKTNRTRLNEQKKAKGRPSKSIDNPDLIYPDDVILVPGEQTTATSAAGDTTNQNPPPTSGSYTRPNYSVNVGSQKFSLDSGPDVVSIRVVRTMGLPIDGCEICLAGGKSYSFAKGDAVKVQLGYDDNFAPVFSGIVDNIEREVSAVKVTALGLAVSLLRLRLNRVYLNQTAGKIVSNLAQEAKLTVKKASDGINLPMYVVDEGKNAYEHVLRLAEQCNFDVYVTEDEALMFKEWGGGKDHTIEYGKELIQVEGSDFSPLYLSAKVYGESPSSMKGSDTSHWLTKQEVKGEAGTGAVLSLHDPAIKDKKTAETAAKARLDRMKYTFAVVVEAVGKPEVKLGDTVTLKGLSDSALSGNLEVRGIEHYLNKTKGFTTRFSCWMR